MTARKRGAKLPPYDETYLLRCALGEIDSPVHQHEASLLRARIAAGHTVPEAWRDALAEGDHRCPEATHPGRYVPVEVARPVEVDPATVEAFDRLTATGTDGAPAAGPGDRSGRVVRMPGASRHPALRPIAGRPGEGYTLGSAPGVWKVGGHSPILPWCPEVLEHLVRLDDDGHPVERQYLVRVGDAEPVVLTAKDLASSPADGACCWTSRFAEATGVGTRARRELLLDVVLDQAAALPSTWMVHRNGWHVTPDGDWRYVHSPDPARRLRPVYRMNRNTAGAYAPVGVFTDAEVTRALAELAGRGWGPLLGLGTGLRALAQALVPVLHPLVVEGDPNTGKSLTAWTAQLPVMAPPAPLHWPPVVDASFVDTTAGMEHKIGEAADRAIHVNDLPLTSEATAKELREGVEKLDRLARAQHDNVAVRDRMDRDLSLRESTYVRGVLVFTVQRLPNAVQSSLWRRLVVARFAEGDNDWRWFGEHGRELVGPIRALGDRMIAALERLGRPAAAELVAECDREGQRRVRAAWEALDVAEPPGMTGVLDGAGQHAAGLVLAEALTGLPTRALLDVLVGPLAASLEAQASTMRDRQLADTGTGDALGNVLRRACLDRRAHTRDPDDDTPRPMVEGLTAPAQGLAELGADRAGRVQGVPLYVFRDRQALGLTPRDLLTLAADSRDSRLAGFEAAGLARHLRREGVTLPGRQAGHDSTTRLRVGARSDGKRLPLVLVPLALVWDLADVEGPDVEGPGPDPGPPSELPPAPPPELPLPPPEAPPAAEAPASAPPPAAERPEAAPGPDGAPERRRRRQRPPRRPSGRWASSTPPASVVTALPGGRLGVLHPDGDGGRWEYPDRLVEGGGLVELLEAVDQVAPPGPVTLLIDPAEHYSRYRLRRSFPARSTSPPKAFRDLHQLGGWCKARRDPDGWHPAGRNPDGPGEPPLVSWWSDVERGPRRVLVLPAAWLVVERPEGLRPREWPCLAVGDDVETMAHRLITHREAVGIDYQGSVAATAVELYGELHAGGNITPLWNLSPYVLRKLPEPSGKRPDWRRELTPAEAAEVTHVHAYDSVRNYLSAVGQARLASGPLAHHPEVTAYDPAPAGLWQITVPPWSHPLVPAPVLDRPPGQWAWASSALVALYVEVLDAELGEGCGAEAIEVHDAWIGRRRHLTGQREFPRHLTAVLDDPATPADVEPAVKGLYQRLHGKLRNRNQRVMCRTDWGYAIRDEARATLLRKVYRAAGVLPIDGKRTTSPVFPLAVGDVDTVIYPGGATPIAPDSFVIAERAGGFRLAASTPISEWTEVKS